MKKILIIISASFGCISAYAQQGKSNSLTPVKSLSVQEANQLNSKAEPTYQGGKPYSQWVAEERAKQRETNKQAVVQIQKEISINAADAKTVINQEPSSKQSSSGIIGAANDVQALKNGEPYKQNPAVTEQKNNEPVVMKQETKPVKEVLPAILKGTSIDPDAKPIVPAAKTPDVVVPAQNSGNTKPAVEQKQVSKENNSVPSSTVPVKKQD